MSEVVVVSRQHLLLGVSEGASRSQLRAAYRARAALLHPDVSPSTAEAFREVTEAYHELLAALPDPGELVLVPRQRVKRHEVASAYGSMGRSAHKSFPTGVYAPLDCSVLLDRTA